MVTSFFEQAIVHKPQPLQRASSMVIYDIDRILFDQIKKINVSDLTPTRQASGSWGYNYCIPQTTPPLFRLQFGKPC